ncbi:hypothetical protein WDY80_24555 (plasmid) [Gordonia hongkongensis]|uniref:hypothetical protein n=1 Tax=Gordonia hongkongensis TaxID=1701090 RepID=UPI0030D1FC67
MTVFVDPASAGVAPGQVFVHHEANGDGDGPMKTRAKFWEVVAVTPRRVRAAEMVTRTVREIPDPDGVFYGGRTIVPVPGSHFAGTESLMRMSVGWMRAGEVLLHLPRRRYIWRSTAARWDGEPVFVHPN